MQPGPSFNYSAYQHSQSTTESNHGETNLGQAPLHLQAAHVAAVHALMLSADSTTAATPATDSVATSPSAARSSSTRPFARDTTGVSVVAPMPQKLTLQEERIMLDWVAKLGPLQTREMALFELSKKREAMPNLALILWHSFGTMAALLQEVVHIYPLLNPPSLTSHASNRVCNALALLQSVAQHPDTRSAFLAAHLPMYLFPLLNTTSKARPFEYLRLTSLGVMGALVKGDKGEVTSFLLSTEIIPLCLRIMETGNELSKTVAIFIVQRILSDETGLSYICHTYERFHAVATVLNNMVQSLVEQQSNRLLKHVVRCYLRLSDNKKARDALRQCLPEPLRDGTFSQVMNDDVTTKRCLAHLLLNLSDNVVSVPQQTTQHFISMSDPYRAQKDFAAGWIGGIAQVLSGQPFDTIKVRLQTNASQYNGPLDACRQLIRQEGFTSFYKGTTVPLIGVGACVSIQFAALEQAKRFLTGEGSASLTTTQLFLAGAYSGLANSVISGPMEHVRIRLQLQGAGKQLYKGALDCIQQLVRQHGFTSLYKGQIITLYREILGYGFYFSAYEMLVQSSLKQYKDRASIPSTNLVFFGACAGYALWIPLYPVDVIKSKLQGDALDAVNRRYAGILDCWKQTWRQQGIRGFYQGFTPCLLRAAPVNAATFVAFEMSMRALNQVL